MTNFYLFVCQVKLLIKKLSILQKHIKRQIISLNGGFQIIADLNAYNAFIVSLKVLGFQLSVIHN